MERNINLFVAGGCHIIGAELGMQNSFVSHVLTSMKQGGREVDATLYPYALLKNPDAILEACCLSHRDLVILQIGNYESTPPSLKKLLQKRFGFGKKPMRSTSCEKQREVIQITTLAESAAESVDDAIAHRQYVHRMTSKQTVKRVVDYLLVHPYVDFKQHEANFVRFLDCLRAKYSGPVLVLGPFPSADPFITTYRRLLSDRFEARARSFDVQFIDVCRTLAQQEVPGAGFVDRLHFNAGNHAILGKLVAEWAGESIRESTEQPQTEASHELVTIFDFAVELQRIDRFY